MADAASAAAAMNQRSGFLIDGGTPFYPPNKPGAIMAPELAAQSTNPISIKELSQARGLLPGTNLIEHQFPLRAGLMVKLTLPTDLTKNEIKRLVRFMESLTR